MTRLLILFIFAATLFACSDNSYQKKLEDIDSLVSKDMEDSALNEIKRLNISNVDDEESKAYYDLLKTEILFRKEIIIKSDTMINNSIAYYTKTNNKKMLTRAYYIKGRTIYDCGRKKDGVICLKQAESFAIDGDDYIIKSKIHIGLACCNLDAGEYDLALSNAKTALRYSKEANNKELQQNSLENMAVIFGYLDQRDSALFYMEKYVPLLKYLPSKDRATSYSNLGAAYASVDTEKAKDYVKKAIAIEPLDAAYAILAAIYQNENKQKLADSYWRKALNICKDPVLKINILEDMFQYKHDTWQYKEASEISDKIIKLKENLSKQQQKDSIKDAQIAYEIQHVEDTAEKENKEDNIVITILIMLCVVGIAYYIYRRRKSKTLLQTQQEQMDNYAKEIEKQRREIKAAEKKLEKDGEKTKEVAKLKKDIDQLIAKQKKAMEAFQTEKTRIMTEGSKLYEMIKGNQNISQWKKAELSTLREYYGLANKQDMNKIGNDYNTLTDQQMMLVIMQHIGKTDDEIIEMTLWKAGNFRRIRSETNSKKK